jgi:hypothetical protein
MEDDGGFKIVKVNQTAPLLKKIRATTAALTAKAPRMPKPAPASSKYTSKHRTAQPKFGILKRGKTARKSARFEGVKDPAKSPPVKKSSRLRILTEHGASTRRAKISREAKSKSIHEIRKTLKKHNLNVNDKTPEPLARKIYEDAQEAGMIVSG